MRERERKWGGGRWRERGGGEREGGREIVRRRKNEGREGQFMRWRDRVQCASHVFTI